MFADACGAKQRDLRVRQDNPASGVHGPDRGVRKAKVYLWPSEFLKLVSCADVPLRWRRAFAVTTYLYVRAGEGNALEWSDVDLERRVVRMHRSADRDTGEKKPTKTSAARRVPIEPELVPLLQAMHDEAEGKGRVLAIDETDRKLSRQLQRCLKLADVTRADLTTSDATRKAMTFHDLRATGITWCAVRGDDPLKIKQRAGHATFSTTEGYIREAENLREGFGAVFPRLPAALLIGPTGPRIGPSDRNWTKNSMISVEAPGIETRDSVELAGFQVDSRTVDPPRVDVSVREPVASGPTKSTPAGSVEDVLAGAIGGAAAAGRWDVVAQLARELEARRLASSGTR